METEKIKEFVLKRLDESKIENIDIIDVSKKTSLTNDIIIGTGRGEKHIESTIDNLRTSLKENFNIISKQAEGKGSKWIILDLNEIFVNLFTEESRKEYKLEDLWKREIK